MRPSQILLPAAVTPLVVAAVRPSRPNDAVIRAAAELADAWAAELVVVGRVEFYVADWGDLPYTESAVIESYEGALFAHCAELLQEWTVPWSVHVTSGNLAMLIKDQNERRPLFGIVLGAGRHVSRLARLRRWVTGSLHSRVRDLHTLVIDSD